MKGADGTPLQQDQTACGRVTLLVARSAFAAAPHREMAELAARAAALPGIGRAEFAFVEQGTPSLLERLVALKDEGVGEIVLLPLMLPVEPGFRAWLTRTLRRWQGEIAGPWPRLSIAAGPAASPRLDGLLQSLLTEMDIEEVPAPEAPIKVEGSLVPAQKRRVLVCAGRACLMAGAEAIWGHLRNCQERRKLRVTGDGVMTAKTTCLGPCSLAPVVQVFPEATWYGGVSETDIDRIVEEHLVAGTPVAELAYHPTGRKQRLRDSTADATRTAKLEDDTYA